MSDLPPPGRKFFTPEKANSTLPLVKRIVRDITDLAVQIQEIETKLETFINAGKEPTLDERDELEGLQDRLTDKAERMRSYHEELTQIGVLLKDYSRGLIDFPCWMDGREVYLCWHQGEEAVDWWHEIEAGFAGRQKISLTPGAFQ